MSDTTTTPVTEQSPSGEFHKASDGKRLAWHISIFTIAAALTPLIDLLAKSLSDGSLDLGKYNVFILGALNIIGQIIRLTASGPPKESGQ